MDLLLPESNPYSDAEVITMTESLHVVCPHCAATNRLPGQKLGEAPACGQCHKSLFDGHPSDVRADAFQRHIQRNDIPVLVDFWAPWCGPCRMMAPQFTQAASLLEPSVRLLKVNTENEKMLASQFGIRSIPTLKLFYRGKEIANQAGAMNANDLVRWVQSAIR